jgi:hypothetical protein
MPTLKELGLCKECREKYKKLERELKEKDKHMEHEIKEKDKHMEHEIKEKKAKRAPNEWAKFAAQYYKDHKSEFNGSFSACLKSSALKEAYAKRHEGGSMKKSRRSRK